MNMVMPISESLPSPARISVRLMRRSEVTLAFVAQWRALAHSSAQANPFYEDWYLLPSLDAFDPTGKVRLFAAFARSDGQEQLIGLLPLARSFQYGRWPIAHITNWVHPNIFLGQPLIVAGHEYAFWNALVSTCDRTAGRALFLHLNRHYADGCAAAALHQVALQRPFGKVYSEQRAMLSISGQSPEAYAATALSGKKRKELRRQANRLAELGTVTHNTRSGREAALGLDAWVTTFLALEARGWKGRAESALACDPRNAALFRAALHGAAETGRLQLLDIRCDGRPVAMLVNFLSSPTAFSFKTTYDEDYARFSPGVLVQMDNLALLNHPDLTSCDSCAAPDHPMIDSLWRERCTVARFSIGIGGTLRRGMFSALLKAELARANAKTTIEETAEMEDKG